MSEKIKYAEVVVPGYTSYWAYKDEAELRRTVSSIDRMLGRPTPSTIRIGISKDVVSKAQYWRSFRKDVKKRTFKDNETFNLGSLVEQ